MQEQCGEEDSAGAFKESFESGFREQASSHY
jgi:hypothetical protein